MSNVIVGFGTLAAVVVPELVPAETNVAARTLSGAAGVLLGLRRGTVLTLLLVGAVGAVVAILSGPAP